MKNSQIHPRLWGRVVSARAIADKKFKCNDDEAGVAPHQAVRLCELTLGDNLVHPRRDSSRGSNGNSETKKEGEAGRFACGLSMSAVTPIADKHGYGWNVRFVPIADVRERAL